MAFSRRRWIGSALALGAASAAVLTPLRVLAKSRPAFTAESTDSALNSLFGDRVIEESDQIELKIPDIAENGAVVPVTVSTDIAGVEKIAIVVDENPNPLSASFSIKPDAFADISTRVKMGKSSRVRALVQTPEKIYVTSKDVKVTIGGCGG